MAMKAPSPWTFQQRAQSGLLEQELAIFASMLSGSTEQGPPARKKKHIREHPSKRGKNRKAQQQNKKDLQRQQRHPKQEPKAPRQDREERGSPMTEPEDVKLKKVGVIDMKGPSFAPLQRKIEDIPIIQLDVKKKGLKERFREVAKRRHNRAKEIAPGLFNNIPMTPYPNPRNQPCRYGRSPFFHCGHSHHRIELLDSEEGEGMLVQLLIRDFDLYLVGFRRYMPDKGWSKWFYFKDLQVPQFLADDSEKLNIDGGHTGSYEIGGHVSFKLVFTKLGAYPETQSKEDLREPALIAVFLFSEAFRDRFMHEEVLLRIEYDLEPMPFGYFIVDWRTGDEKYLNHGIISKRLHSWSTFCGQCIKAGTKDGGWFNEEVEMKGYDVLYELRCFEDMIGTERGLLLVLNWGLDMSEEDVSKPGAGLNCPNPGFNNVKGKELIFYDGYGNVITELSLS